MSSGVSRTMTGAFTGTAADLDVKTVGFRPRKVELFNQTGLVTGVWTNTMADGLALKRITAGDATMTSAGEGVTPLAEGFRMGADADVNGSGELVHWVASE